MNDTEELLRAALLKVPAGLAEHVVRVVDEAARLAKIHGVNKEGAKIAALGHDLLRAMSNERLLTIAVEQGYQCDAVDGMEPVLLHGPLAVRILREQYGVLDADVLGAVAYHTIAHAGMTPLQKVIFVADKIEPHKRERIVEVERVASLAITDLDAAMLAYLDYHVRFAVETGWPIHPNTIAARNEFIARRRTRDAKREHAGES